MFYFLDFDKLINLFLYDAYDPLLFSSAFFMFLFFFLLIIYRISSPIKAARVLVLILFSLFFYYKSNGIYFLLLVVVSAANYFAALGISKNKGLAKRLIFYFTIALNLLLLGYFKYTNFFISIYNDTAGTGVLLLDTFLPIGISFYTFKVISYLTDVYWEVLEPERNFLDFTLYVTYFGNILAGPIDRAANFLPQVKKDYYITKVQLSGAVVLIISGLIKKVIIADYISVNFVDRVFDYPTRFSGIENLIAVYGYTLQIYCDFSGYTDLALGISLLLGYKLMANFNFPYRALSVADFWRRWHISLSSWLLDYLFRPLQMKFRDLRLAGNILALLITFTLCGFWHGADWTFLVWGLLHGFYMGFSILTAKPRKYLTDLLGLTGTKFHKFLQWFITFNLVAFAWIFFRSAALNNAWDMLRQITGFFHSEILPQFLTGYPAVVFLIIFGYLLHFIPQKTESKTVEILSGKSLFTHAVILAVVIWTAAQIKTADLQPFLYFQF